MDRAMPEVTIHLHIENSSHFGGGELYRKTIETPFLPRCGERVTLFPYRGEPAYDGPMVEVEKVYWGADGSVYLDLEPYVIDPSEQMETHVGRVMSSGWALHAWRSERDGDLRALLVENGWSM